MGNQQRPDTGNQDKNKTKNPQQQQTGSKPNTGDRDTSVRTPGKGSDQSQKMGTDSDDES